MNDSPITIANYTSTQLLSVSPKLVWSLFGIVLLFFGVMSTIIIYHLNAYSYAPKAATLTIKIYAIGSGILILSALAGCIIYTLSL